MRQFCIRDWLLATFWLASLSIPRIAARLVGLRYAIIIPLLFAAVWVLALEVRNRGCVSLGWKTMRRTLLVGGLSAALATLVIVADVGHELSSATNGEYWNWGRDWPYGVTLIAGEAVVAAAMSAVVHAVAVKCGQFFAARRK